MPNHVTNKLRIAAASPEQLEEIREFLKHGKSDFSFECVFPMPPELVNTQSPPSMESLLLIAAPEGARGTPFEPLIPLANTARAVLATNPVPQVVNPQAAPTIEWEKNDDVYQSAKSTLKAIIATGYPDWYKWALEHWGTKWDAYDVSVDIIDGGSVEILECVFDTAWSAPTEVIRELSRRFPRAMFHHTWFDEGWNHAGDMRLMEGYTVFGADGECRPTAVLYEYVYGHPIDYEDSRNDAIDQVTEYTDYDSDDE